MKKFFSGQTKGLVWFVVIYALVRIFLSNPEIAIQGKETFAIALGSLAFLWLLFPKIMGENSLALSLSFFSLSGYSLLTWTKFDFGLFSSSWFSDIGSNDDKVAVLIAFLILVMSIIMVITDIVMALRETSKKGQVWWPAPVWLLIVTVVIVAFDILLPKLFTMFSTSNFLGQ